MDESGGVVPPINNYYVRKKLLCPQNKQEISFSGRQISNFVIPSLNIYVGLRLICRRIQIHHAKQ